MPKWRTEQEDAEGPCQIRFVPGLRVPRPRTIRKGVVMIFCWGGPDFKPQTNDR
jgi:hypothetical protein